MHHSNNSVQQGQNIPYDAKRLRGQSTQQKQQALNTGINNHQEENILTAFLVFMQH